MLVRSSRFAAVLLVFVFFVTVALRLHAQDGAVRVRVTDSTGAVVEGAEVVFRRGGAERVAMTGQGGLATVSGLAAGDWQVIANATGFAPGERAITIAGVGIEVTLALEPGALSQAVSVESTPLPEPIQLQAPAVGGTRLGIPVLELPASLSVVTNELIVERGARTAVEAVELSVGMNAQIGVGSIPSYSTRGFSGNSVSIMRNGIRQNTSSQSSRPVDTFIMDRVEVLKGPGSLMYGEGAIGAAVNYVSREPGPLFGGQALLSFGSFNTHREGIGLNIPLRDSLSVRIDAAHSGTDGHADRSDQALDSVAGSVRWTPGDRVNLLASGTYTDDNTTSYYGTPYIDGGIDSRTRLLNYNMRDNIARSHNSWGSLQTDIDLGSGWTLRDYFFAATHRFDWRNMEGYRYDPATEMVDVRSYFLIWRDDTLFGNRLDARKTLVAGGRTVDINIGTSLERNDLRRAGLSDSSVVFSVDPYDPEPIVDPGLDYAPQRDVLINTRSIYGETLVQVTGRLKLIGGLRWESIHLDYTTTSVTPNTLDTTEYTPFTGRAGAVFSVAANANFYVSYSRAVEPTTQFVSLSGSDQIYSLTPGRQWEGGFKTSIAEGRVSLTLAYFDIEKRDILTTSFIDGVRTAQQIGRQVSRGVELALAGRVASTFHLSGDVAFTGARFDDFTEIVGDTNVSRDGNAPTNAPRIIANLTPSFILGPFEVSSTLRYVGDRYGDNANERIVAGYTTVQAAVAYSFAESYRITVRGRNLTDEIYTPGHANADYMRLAEPRSVDVTLDMRF
jgi:iron complex outermembrane receptor protein